MLKRRSFMGLAAAAGFGAAARSARASTTRGGSAEEAPNFGDVDPYFLDRGDVSAAETEQIESYTDYQEQVTAGKPALMPRGGRPKRAPTFRLLHWSSESGRFVGPLSIESALSPAARFNLNAQILGFHTSKEDWSKKASGTLTIEFRGRWMGDSMTWFYAQQFDSVRGGGTTLGLEYVAQRDGVPEPVICEGGVVDLRIQLLRHRKSPGALRKVLNIGSFLIGTPSLGGIDGMGGQQAAPPMMRVPRMLHEGVALTQGMVGSMADEAPIWRSGFTTYSLATGGGRMRLRPGLWIAMDQVRETNLSGVELADFGGGFGLARNGEPLDMNYLILDFEIAPA